jgi:DNA-binding beta-propeller fold protein YncE
MAVRDNGHIFVMSRSSATATPGLRIVECDLYDHFYGEFGSHGKGAGQFIWPSAMTIGPDSRLYAADDALNRITVFDPDNNLAATWGEEGSERGQLSGPSGLAFDPEGNLLVVDHRNHRVQLFSTEGKHISTFGSHGTDDGQFNYPWGVTVDTGGRIYVADWRNDRIQRFSPDGGFIDAFGESGRASGQLSRPTDVAVSADGTVYVADWMNQRVQVFDSSWRFIESLRGQATLSKWAVEYLAANADEQRARESFRPVIEVDTDDPHEQSARIESYFWDPVDVEVDGAGRLYVLETNRNRFQVYGPPDR